MSHHLLWAIKSNHFNKMLKLSLSLFFFLFLRSVSAQQLTMPVIFNDHMVLQHGENVKFWGWSRPNSIVTVLMGDLNIVTEANGSGEWELYLPKQDPGGPHTITVDSRNTLTFEDVYFGDVWFAGGQSNMEWQVGANIDNMDAELNDAEYPEIRFFKVAHDLSVTPLNRLKQPTEWKIANKNNARNFSAVAWFFAKHNHTEKNVPVGIIDDNWGGTPAEAWTPTPVLINVPGYEEEAAEYLEPAADWDVRIAENEAKSEEKYRRVQDTEEFLSYGAHLAEYNDAGWQNLELPNQAALEDFVWLRKTFDLQNVSDAQLSFGNPGKFTVAFINGEHVYTKTWSDDPEIIPIDSDLLKEGENVIAIRTVEDWDNRTFFGSENDFWIQTESLNIPLNGTWKFSNMIEPPMPEVIRYEHEPGFLFNSMINPLAGFTIKGAIWYQGESNVAANQYYNVLFESMIESWREVWNQGDFPFLFVQLANYQERYDSPTESGWARLQEAQTQTLSLNNTGMATIIDIGDANDIHPRNKQDVGYRLWQAARHVAYHEDIVYSGPMYRGHVVDGNKVIVSFNHVGSGLVNKKSEGSLPGFTLAGSDSVFHWADATISGDLIILESDEVENPIAVRYAWADNPETALYNFEGLPAVPFRTDDW